MEGISNLKACMEYCGIVEMPNRDMLWDGESEFEKGIAYVQRIWMGDSQRNFAVVAFNKKYGDKPYIINSFNGGVVKLIEDIFVIPKYSTNVQRIIPTGINPVLDQLNSPFSNMSDIVETTKFEPKDGVIEANLEWVIPNIHNEEEARKWLIENRIKAVHLIKNKDVLISKIKNVLLQKNEF